MGDFFEKNAFPALRDVVTLHILRGPSMSDLRRRMSEISHINALQFFPRQFIANNDNAKRFKIGLRTKFRRCQIILQLSCCFF
jgi:hypothetical protein